MKSCVLCALVLLLTGCPAVFSAETADSIDWGTKTVITAASGSQSSVNDPIIISPADKNALLVKGSLMPMGATALVTPDGESIIYTDMRNGIWKVPVGGGTPEVMFDAIYLYP